VDIQTLIDKAGGVQALASKLGVARTTVLDWRRTGFIPANRVGQISSTLRIAVAQVQKLAPGPKPRASAAPETPSMEAAE